ncbi:MAG: hypothetical protein JST44_19600 [Cyanobacteria bacterium SZAS LIN-5]|nr:hypothetical protein [Cyanobacteria bacterium SZAS LIN-5]
MSHSHHEHDIARKVGHDLTHHHHHEAVQHLMKEFHSHDSKEFNHLLKNIQKSLHGHHDLSVERHNGKITHINFDHHDIYGGHAHDKKHSKDAERTGNTKDAGHSKHAEKNADTHDPKHSKHAEKSAETHDPKHSKHAEKSAETHDPKHSKHAEKTAERHDPKHPKHAETHDPKHPKYGPKPEHKAAAPHAGQPGEGQVQSQAHGSTEARNATPVKDQQQLKDDTARHRQEHEKAKKEHVEEKPLTEQQQHVKGLLEKHLGHPIDRPQFEAYMDRARRQHAERTAH